MACTDLRDGNVKLQASKASLTAAWRRRAGACTFGFSAVVRSGWGCMCRLWRGTERWSTRLEELNRITEARLWSTESPLELLFDAGLLMIQLCIGLALHPSTDGLYATQGNAILSPNQQPVCTTTIPDGWFLSWLTYDEDEYRHKVSMDCRCHGREHHF